MAALDKYHQAVIRALEKDGWKITHNPLQLQVGTRNLAIDLAAERFLTAERGAKKIAVEIKTFGSASPVAALEQAIGQYVLYESVLEKVEPERELYLAIPERARLTIFAEEIGQLMLEERLHRVFVYSPEAEEILEWMPLP